MWSKKKLLRLILFALAACLLRLIFVHRFVVGDLLAHSEWGELYWEIGSKGFYFYEDWYYSFPTQPPLINLLFAFSYWLYERKYLLAELHNLIKIPPAFVIIYFYDWGYIFLLKLWGVLGDLVLAFIAYWSVYELTDSYKRSLGAYLFVLFNPVTIFLSSVWGQTGSLVAVFGILSFILLVKDRIALSVPLLFISLYLKPTWVILVPLYLFILLTGHKNVKGVILGSIISFIIFLVTTRVFVENNMIEFINDIVINNMLPSAKGGARTSISAFNFYTIFHRIDFVLTTEKLLFLTWEYLGYIIFLLINAVVFIYMRVNKDKEMSKMFIGIFAISMGSYLFMTNMLERYFFAAFVPMVIIMFYKTKTAKYVLLINLILFGNLFWAFFRRSVGPVNDLFTDNNFFLIRLSSVALVLSYFSVLKRLDFSQVIKRDR